MYKLLLLELFVFASYTCFCQNNALQSAFQSGDNKIIENGDYFIVQLNNQKDSLLVREAGFSISRQLSPNLFIISASRLSNRKALHQLEFASTANNLWKLSPALLQKQTDQSKLTSRFYTIYTNNPEAIRIYEKNNPRNFKILSTSSLANILLIELLPGFSLDSLLHNNDILFIESTYRNPSPESPVKTFDHSLNAINLAHKTYPGINGSGLTVSVKENLYDSSDIDLIMRTISSAASSKSISQHATNIATIIAGAGNSSYTGRGVAWGASISSADFKNLLPDYEHYLLQKISVQNHSYGVGIENYYGADAAAYDASMLSNQPLVHVFSSGNAGTDSAVAGFYTGITGYANLTGSFKMAKNILTVGSLSPLGIVPASSSKGPAYDGRVKPDLVANGESGSSEAAATVSGIVLLLQDAFRQKNQGKLPENSLVKAVLLNAADDVGPKGIDFSSGFGNANAYRALLTLEKEQYIRGSIKPNEKKDYTLSIPPKAINLKITLVWNDRPSVPNSFKSLVNDLDLELHHPASSASWLPWVLNSFPLRDSLQNAALRKKDRLNVVEQISVEYPVAGDYVISVIGHQLQDSAQSFSIAYQWDTADDFRWNYPIKSDKIISAMPAVLRWNSTLNHTTGILSFSKDGGRSWILIDSAIYLSNNKTFWASPDWDGKGLFRMTVRERVFYSDTFSISNPLSLKLGYRCQDSILLYWNKSVKADKYQVFNLRDKYLSAVATTSDSFLVLPTNTLYSPYYAVQPMNEQVGFEGIKSPTINENFQGIGCFIRTFLADLQSSNRVGLSVTISSPINIAQISFEKQVRGSWTNLHTVAFDGSFQYTSLDTSINNGVNYYRARITLNSGRNVFTEIVPVYSISRKDYLVFPNPATASQNVKVLSKAPENQLIELYDLFGRIIRSDKLNAVPKILETQSLAPGIYIIVIRTGEKIVFKEKLVLQ